MRCLFSRKSGWANAKKKRVSIMRHFTHLLLANLLGSLFDIGLLFAQDSMSSHNAAATFEKVQRILRNTGDWPLSIELNHPDDAYRSGQNLSFSVLSPKRCYLHVFNLTPEGDLNMVWPTDATIDNTVNANVRTSFPSSGQDVVKITVSEPLGAEMLIFFATTSRLHLEASTTKARFNEHMHLVEKEPLRQLFCIRDFLVSCLESNDKWAGIGKVVTTGLRTP